MDINPYAYIHPLIYVKEKAEKRVDTFSSRFSSFKSRIYEKLGLACLFPKLLRPFSSIMKYMRCKLGIKEDDFLESPKCDVDRCLNPKVENKFITHDLGIPNLDPTIEEKVSTIDGCFPNMPKMDYGVRIRADIVEDGDCEHEKYKKICEEEMNSNRILFEEKCKTLG